jgi:hypothetical protein
MLVYVETKGDSMEWRIAKLEALRKHYKESAPAVFNSLSANDLSKSNSNRGDKLIVNSHGNVNVFAGMDADQFYKALVGKGFENGAFKSMYLIACDVSKQDQKNSIYDKFALDLFRIMRANDINIKLYAPRGTVTYNVIIRKAESEEYIQVTSIVIDCPEKVYTLDEGMLLVML